MSDRPEMVFGTDDGRAKYLEVSLRAYIAYSLKLIRAQRDLTQEQAAKLCGLSTATWNRLEDWNAEFPTVETLQKVARGFDFALKISFEKWSDYFQDTGVPVAAYHEEASKEAPPHG